MKEMNKIRDESEEAKEELKKCVEMLNIPGLNEALIKEVQKLMYKKRLAKEGKKMNIQMKKLHAKKKTH